MAVAADDRGGGDQRVEHGFLRRLGHRLEQEVDASLVQRGHRHDVAALVVVGIVVALVVLNRQGTATGAVDPEYLLQPFAAFVPGLRSP